MHILSITSHVYWAKSYWAHIHWANSFDLIPHEQFHDPMLIIGLCVAGCILLALIVATIYGYTPRASLRETTTHSLTDRNWKAHIRAVEDEFTAGKLDSRQAFVKLSHIIRDFASHQLRKDVRSMTLADFESLSVASAQKDSFDILKRTIEGLYPPEFAYAPTHAQASQVTVIQACQWVTHLIERWEAR